MYRWWRLSCRFSYVAGPLVNINIQEKSTVSIFWAAVRVEGFTAVRMIISFWVLMPSSLVGWCQHLAQIYCTSLQGWKCRHYVPPNLCHLLTNSQSVITQNNIILTTVKASNLTRMSSGWTKHLQGNIDTTFITISWPISCSYWRCISTCR
jgi:hypothetical protein